jgi:hypothetical protein
VLFIDAFNTTLSVSLVPATVWGNAGITHETPFVPRLQLPTVVPPLVTSVICAEVYVRFACAAIPTTTLFVVIFALAVSFHVYVTVE